MKFNALRTKAEPKEFVFIDVIEKTMIIYTSELPKPQPLTATVENTKNYYEHFNPLPDQMTFDDMEMVELEIFETNVGADIRNKLTSPLSLTAMLKHYFKEKDSEVKAQLEQLIKNEIKQSEKDIKYIAKLL